MVLVGIGGDSGLSDCVPKGSGGLVDERMVDGAIRGVDDAVGAGLEQANLGAPRATAYGQPGAVAMAPPRRAMDAGRRQAGLGGELREGGPRGLRQSRGSETGAARAGRAVGAIVWSGHPRILPLRAFGAGAGGPAATLTA